MLNAQQHQELIAVVDRIDTLLDHVEVLFKEAHESTGTHTMRERLIYLRKELSDVANTLTESHLSLWLRHRAGARRAAADPLAVARTPRY